MQISQTQSIYDRPAPRERKRNPFTKSARGGRILSAMMLPLFLAHPPRGFGVLTTTGRRTGKTRRKCVRVIRRGEKAYLVMLGPALLGEAAPKATAAWLWNIRANPNVHLRIRGAALTGMARELDDSAERCQARQAYYETVNVFDYLECCFHTAIPATSAKIQHLHRCWFDAGIPLAIDLHSNATTL
jgi:deazaflavin-dependent oxidoreductase (nitroreductase family)